MENQWELFRDLPLDGKLIYIRDVISIPALIFHELTHIFAGSLIGWAKYYGGTQFMFIELESFNDTETIITFSNARVKWVLPCNSKGDYKKIDYFRDLITSSAPGWCSIILLLIFPPLIFYVMINPRLFWPSDGDMDNIEISLQKLNIIK